MLDHFLDWKPDRTSFSLIIEINSILEQYEQQGYKLTLRQLYYQLVARDLISNNVRAYANVGRIVSRGRLAGMIDWSMIEDRTRTPSENIHWSSPKDIVEAASSSYYRSRWIDQPNYVEVWCEKDAVSNIIEPVCRALDVMFMANRGYSSQTAMYDAYRRLYKKIVDEKRQVHLIYVGDHDPSGLDMTEDISNRLGLFLTGDKEKKFSKVWRVALNMEQVLQYNPPENPAKVTDSRYKNYAMQYGVSSWELDALEPAVLSNIVRNAIMKYIDMNKFKAVEDEEEEHKKKIRGLINVL